jgi:hypothetical protein
MKTALSLIPYSIAFHRDRSRLLTYREFCERLTDPEWRTWVDGLIVFHLETARGEKERRPPGRPRRGR